MGVEFVIIGLSALVGLFAVAAKRRVFGQVARMFKLIYRHKELKKLDWLAADFIKFCASGDIRNTSAYKAVLVVRVFGLTLNFEV